MKKLIKYSILVLLFGIQSSIGMAMEDEAIGSSPRELVGVMLRYNRSTSMGLLCESNIRINLPSKKDEMNLIEIAVNDGVILEGTDDYNKAVKWHDKLSESGDLIPNRNNFGVLLEYLGHPGRAFECYSNDNDGEHLNPSTMNNLGRWYINHENNPEEAKKCFLEAAKRDNKDAWFNLGIWCINYQDDLDAAKEFFFVAARQGHPLAKEKLKSLLNNPKK